MDTRIALKPGKRLHGKEVYTITKEIGRGGSCIAYEAYYVYSEIKIPVVIKECYPFELNISRKENHALSIQTEESAKFAHFIKRFENAYDANLDIYSEYKPRDFVIPGEIFAANNTKYSVTHPIEGRQLTLDSASSVENAVHITKNIAQAVLKIHERGYLCLDIKPANIWISANREIQFFDFDSFIPYSEKGIVLDEIHRISYSKGFAPLEQQLGNPSEIGKWSDVYSIGALLYYFIFRKVPSALDCSGFIKREYNSGLFEGQHFSDNLFPLLDEFFENTLTPNYKNRYPEIRDVLSVLEKIDAFTNSRTMFITSKNPIIPCIGFSGREKEIGRLKEWFEHSMLPIVISGLGGIGKSTLVRQFLLPLIKDIKNVYYLNFNRSFIETICDDNQLHINTVCRYDNEPMEEYFLRKISSMKEALANETTIFVIDNLSGELPDEFNNLISSNWKVILITREKREDNRYESLDLKEIIDTEILVHIMESVLDKELVAEEREQAKSIIEKTYHNTLLIGLLAKQAKSSNISLEELNNLINCDRISTIEKEKIKYSKDFEKPYYTTIGGLLKQIFSISSVSNEKRILLKIIAAFSAPTLSIKDLQTFTQEISLDSIHELTDFGWINNSGDIIEMHPLIRDCILNDDWTDEEKAYLLRYTKQLSQYIYHLGHKDQMPAKIVRKLKAANEMCPETNDTPFFNKMRKKQAQNHGFLGELMLERNKNMDYETPIDRKRLNRFMEYAKAWHAYARFNESFRSEAVYIELIYTLSRYLPENHEDDILNFIHEAFETGFDFNPHAFMILSERACDIYLRRSEYENAQIIINQAKKYAQNEGNSFAWGRYYDLLGEYYDTKLDGNYFEESELLDNLLESVDLSIKNMKKATLTLNQYDQTVARVFYAKYMLSKANLMMRCVYHFPPKDIRKLIEAAAPIIDEETSELSRERYELMLVYARYYSEIEHSEKCFRDSINIALRYAQTMDLPYIDAIDEILIPIANMFFDMKNYVESITYIEGAMKYCDLAMNLCEEEDGIKLYQRKKKDLYECLLDIYVESDDNENASKIKEIINEQYSK